MKVFILAGEASGDVLGAQVLTALKTKFGEDLEVKGLGGDALARVGLKSIFPMADVAVMGIIEVLRRYRRLSRRLAELKSAIAEFDPDVLLLIDAQGLSYRLGKAFVGTHIRKIQLVAPTVWAWKPERAAKAATYLDHMACLFPFEPKYFEAEGLAATYVGHPALKLQSGPKKAEARSKLGIEATEIWPAILPGSRDNEVSQLCPVFTKIIEGAYAQGKISGILLPVAGPVSAQVEAWASRLKLPVRLLKTAQERSNVSAADFALAASGTVSLELAAQGVPAILAYRFHPLTWQLVKRRLAVSFMGLINLLADQEVQPEYLLNTKSISALELEFVDLAGNTDRRERMRAAQFSALQELEISGQASFGERVAALI